MGSGSSGGLRFEDAFRRLETLVAEMEKGELPLEQMLDRFEEGVRLVRKPYGVDALLAQLQAAAASAPLVLG